MAHTLTRRERIVVLLEHYQDALPGLVRGEWQSGEGHALLADEVWNHASYQQLERLRVRLRDEAPRPYWHLAETYFRAGRRRVASCPRCERQAPPGRVGELCNHGKQHAKTVAMVPRVVRAISAAVRPEEVGLGITWLDHNWRGDPSLPPALFGEKVAA